MLFQIALSTARLKHEFNRREVHRKRRLNWRTNYTARKQALDRESRKIMAMAAKAQQERSHAAIESARKDSRKPGLMSRVAGFFKPRTMQHA